MLIKASLAGCLWPQSHTALGGCPWASQPLPGWGTNDYRVWGTRYLLNRVHTSSQRFRGTRLPWAPKYVLNGSPGEPQLGSQPLQGALEVSNASWVGHFLSKSCQLVVRVKGVSSPWAPDKLNLFQG